jgi:hypothetical protein
MSNEPVDNLNDPPDDNLNDPIDDELNDAVMLAVELVARAKRIGMAKLESLLQNSLKRYWLWSHCCFHLFWKP